MSYTVPSAPAEHRSRPGAVSAAVWLLYLVALLWLLSAVVAVVVFPQFQEVFERYVAEDTSALQGQDAETFVTIATWSAVGVSLVTGLLFAIGLSVLAGLTSRGKNVARIITWVVAGLGACCAFNGVLSAAGSSFTSGLTGGGTGDANRLSDLMTEVLPSWYMPVSIAFAVLELLALLLAIVLLALPGSNAYFRKAPPAWEPPVPGYPQVPPPTG